MIEHPKQFQLMFASEQGFVSVLLLKLEATYVSKYCCRILGQCTRSIRSLQTGLIHVITSRTRVGVRCLQVKSTHRDRGGSGTKILGHTDGSLRSPPRV